ncbi:L-asparaginase 1 [Magnaporthiopsis poae ATCC 64411]|uniref:L-asparaginase 1 n=1 Tax=Magnaporthiopsis poae (strain ATCC 64411 / 73-15) TaxID=644358 RepID=A0A0C4EFU1_MAGP6|nr:L-asparaginase 1 [Magnaporthiopsis poae ATCC 64411]
MRPDAPVVQLGSALRVLVADCLPTPFLYAPPVVAAAAAAAAASAATATATTTVRAFAGSGTGNGDSFMRTAALRTVAALARFGAKPSAAALTAVAGPGGELQRSAGERWGVRGEGEGGIIGIEVALVRDAEGRTLEVRSEIAHDHNCGGMYRAWIDDQGKARYQVFKDVPGVGGYEAEGAAEDVRRWSWEKTIL